MKRWFGGLLFGLMLVPSYAVAQKVEVREEVLANGMRLLMVERHQVPVIFCGWVARVGSVNERPGITGISHLFEHMMFKGTKVIGIEDYEEGMKIQSQQDAVRAEMEKEYSSLREKVRRGEVSGNIYDPDNMTPRLKELRAELEGLFAEEKKIIVKDEMDQIYTREGGLGLNAFTTEDQTGYFVNIPANKLKLWFWLESDRLLNPVFREFYSERDVVREERRMRTESTPTGELDEQFNAMFWQSSPYSWPVVGWASDVESITRTQAEDYFSTYYAPNNLSAILVGDFDPEEVLALAREYFERIPRGKIDPPEVITDEVEQKGAKKMTGEADTTPSVTVRFHAPPFSHKDTFALNVLADVLNGRTGRLYKALVEDQGIAVGQPYAMNNELKYGGYFQMRAMVKDGATHQAVENALLEELEKLKKELASERELQKVKNNVMADSYRRLQSEFFLLFQLISYESLGDWSYINELPEKLQAVTAADLQQVAEKYFTPENRNIAWYSRKEGSEPEDPELAGLPAQMRAMVKQQLAQIQGSNDPDQLQAGLARLQSMSGQVPPEVKPALEYLIKKTQERIAELESLGAGDSPEGGN